MKFTIIFAGIIIVLLLSMSHMKIVENIQNGLIFYPSKEIYSSPEQAGIKSEEVFIKTEDGETLHGYYLPSPHGFTSNVIIYLHGNAENVSAWYEAPVLIQRYVPVNALIVDYRGYGKSTGKPTIEGTIIDAQAMYKFLIKRGFKGEDISLYGRSIGGAIALELAIRETVRSVVVQSSFTSLRDIAKEIYPFLPDVLIENNHWHSKDLIKKITYPILISHGDRDQIVSISHSYKLFEAANEPKKLIILKGASHNDVSSYFTDEYFNVLKELFL